MHEHHHHDLTVKKVDRLSPTRVKLHLEFSKSTVAEHEKATVRRYASSAQIPGFRAGKAPEAMVMKKYGDQIRQDLVQHLLEAGLHEALEKTQLYPISQPKIQLKSEFSTTANFEFEAEFEVEPEIELRKYKGIPISREEISVGEAEVTSTLSNLQERLASLEPAGVEKAEKGLFGILEIGYTVQSNPPKTEPTQSITAELGVERLLPELDQAILNMGVGESKEVTAKYPDEYTDKSLAGQTAVFQIKLLELKKKVLPELNDNFANQVRKDATLEKLKSDIQSSIEAEKRDEQMKSERETMIRFLVDNNPFEVPQSLVDRQLVGLFQRVERDLKSQGMSVNNLKEKDIEALKKRAEQMVKSSLLLREVAAKEKITLDSNRFEARVAAIAEQMKKSVDETKSFLKGKGFLSELENEVLTEQVFEFLQNNAEISTKAASSKKGQTSK